MAHQGTTLRLLHLPRRSPILLGLLLAAGLTAGCSHERTSTAAPAPQVEATRKFTEVAAAAGIDHVHHKPVLDPQLDNIMPWMASVGAAVAAGDFDDDGWIDLFVTNSRKGEPNFLYHNNGDGTFTDVAAAAGLAAGNDERGASMDAVWGDFDNDGWSDLYLVRWGSDSLYRNAGDGTFTEVTDQLFRRRDGKPGIDWANGNAAIFLDADRDGRLDVYVGNYFREVDLWHLQDTHIMHDDFERARNAGRNFFYHQQPDGTFKERAAELGLDDPGWTLAVGSADLDGDAWPDLYVANDFGPDQLYLGNGDGTFRNASESVIGHDTKKGMNVDFGDFNNDGWLDVYVTNITTAEYLQEGNMLWYNQGREPGGELLLTDISRETGTWDGGWGWGAKFFDSDNDGDLDLITVNGFISAGPDSYWYDLASWTVLGLDTAEARNWPVIGDRSFSGYEPLRLWRNDTLYDFFEESAEVGLASDRDGRGIAVLDYDNDGDLDVYLANQGQAPELFRNDLASPSHWLEVELEIDPAAGVNRDGVGTRVTLLTPGGLRVRERDGGNSYSGQSDPRLHFGLGDSAAIELLEVRWPDGNRQYVENVAVDQLLTVRQDPSRYATEAVIDVESPSWKPAARDAEADQEPPAIAPEELDRQLGEMEGRLRASFDRALATTYRVRAATYGAHDRAVRFLEEVVAERGTAEERIELSLAYVDKIPTCGGLAAIVCKGSLANKGLVQLDQVLAEDPTSWLALYSRGMNHLHWPRALRHSAAAAEDFEQCVALQARAGVTQPYFERTWIALGEAYAKDGRYDKAREAWRRGLAVFPGSSAIEEYLAITDDAALLERVQSERSLERPLDTDLSFYQGKP